MHAESRLETLRARQQEMLAESRLGTLGARQQEMPVESRLEQQVLLE